MKSMYPPKLANSQVNDQTRNNFSLQFFWNLYLAILLFIHLRSTVLDYSLFIHSNGIVMSHNRSVSHDGTDQIVGDGVSHTTANYFDQKMLEKLCL